MDIGIGMFLKHQVSAQHLASGQLIAGGSEMLRFSLICGEFITHQHHCFCISCCPNCECQFFVLAGCQVVTLLHLHSKTRKRWIWTNVGLYASGLLDLKTCVQTGHHARPANSSSHIVPYCFYMPWLAESCHGSFCCWGCFPSSRLGVFLCRTSVCSKPAHPHSLLEAAHSSHVFVKKINMFFHTVYTLFVT